MRKFVLASLLLALAACSNESTTPGADMGTAADLGGGDLGTADLGTPVDLGAADLGTPVDLGSDAGTPTDAGTPIVELITCPAEPSEVIVAAFTGGFVPNDFTYNLGDTVRVQNADDFAHTFTQRTSATGEPATLEGGFDFEVPSHGEICLRVNAVGSFPYYCEFHPAMLGVLTVIDD